MAEVTPQEYRMVAVGDLNPHLDNPHRGDVDVIVASIKKHGFYGSVVAQKSRMRIVAGEHRWRGATKAGLKHVPTVIIDVDDETAKRIMLADNRLAEYGEYDDAKLAELLQGLPDLDGTGWRDEDLADLLDDLGDDIESVRDEPAQPKPATPPAPNKPPPPGTTDTPSGAASRPPSTKPSPSLACAAPATAASRKSTSNTSSQPSRST